MLRTACIFLLSTMASMSASLSSAAEVFEFESDELRLRYQTLTRELRCPKCQNQNLADSNSQSSASMRDAIFESIQAGQTDEQIRAMMVARYGNFVLYKPPVTVNTWLLWWTPALMILVFFGVFIYIIYKRKKQNVSADGANTSQ